MRPFGEGGVVLLITGTSSEERGSGHGRITTRRMAKLKKIQMDRNSANGGVVGGRLNSAEETSKRIESNPASCI